MSFYNTLNKYDEFNFSEFSAQVTFQKVQSILDKDRLSPEDFLALLTPQAAEFIEQMAQKASQITRRQFGKVMFLFTPLYISNFCENVCPYCSFARQHGIDRIQLTIDEIKSESLAIAKTGMRNVLVLTGESRKKASFDFIREAIEIIRQNCATVSIEMYPMKQSEYAALIKVGIHGLTIFQETYNEKLYHDLHKGGPKDDFLFRLEAPERAGTEKIRSLTVGTLLGLNDPVSEAFFAGLHAEYLQSKFNGAEIAMSLPRIRPMVSQFSPKFPVSDRMFVQILLAIRLFLPRCGITISTRESKEFRDAIACLGVTKMSAGVSTSVGGHGEKSSKATQFEIADSRSLAQLCEDLNSLGFQPVMQDWNSRLFSEIN